MIASRTTFFAMTALAAAVAGLPEEAAGAIPRHELAIGIGPSSTGAYFLLSWTSRKQVGAYMRLFPTLDDDHEARANSTATDESAGEIGIAVRIAPWLTLGAGYGVYEKEVTTYGDLAFLFGVPLVIDDDLKKDAGAAALVIFTFTRRSKLPAFALAVSLSPAGSGAAIGVTF